MKRIEKQEKPEAKAEKKEVAKSVAYVGKKSRISPKAPVLPPFEHRKDRVGRYFKNYVKDFVFDEFSPAYLQKLGDSAFLKEVSIPLRKEDYEAFRGGDGLKLAQIAENMVCIMGADPRFKYVPQYIEFMNRSFGPKILEGILKQGRDYAEDGKFEEAALRFRGTLVLKPDYKDSMYSYARACREIYLAGNDEERIGRFKAESIEYFELLTDLYPRFAEAFYFLGYGYLNLGLYKKADLTWERYLKVSNHPKDRKEIKERREQLKQPIEIENGCNSVLAGRYEEGIGILEPYVDTSFKGWWPLSYYLGVAHARLGQTKPAFVHFKRAININPSHLETMKELADLYAITKDKENEQKYRKKAELVAANQKSDLEQEQIQEENQE